MPAESSLHPLRLVDARTLDEGFRAILRPGELIRDAEGRARRLPVHYYEVPSWDAALATQLTPHFGVWELLDVDFREAERMRTFPRYVPCAITLLAAYLELFRERLGSVVRIAANGGYRSPGHALSTHASPHSWGAAANIYRIGSEMMDSQERIEKYGRLAEETLRGVRARPFAFDHVHVDLGYLTVEP